MVRVLYPCDSYNNVLSGINTYQVKEPREDDSFCDRGFHRKARSCLACDTDTCHRKDTLGCLSPRCGELQTDKASLWYRVC